MGQSKRRLDGQHTSTSRSPVASLQGYAQMLRRTQARGQLDGARLARAIDRPNESATRPAGLTEDLLDIARMQLGQLPLRLEALDLAALVEAVVTRYREELDAAHQLVLRADAERYPVPADPGRLEQVLTNLLDNARKYSPAGGGIAVSLKRQATGVLLAESAI